MAQFTRVPCSVFVTKKLEPFQSKDFKDPKTQVVKFGKKWYRHVVTVPTMDISFILRTEKDLVVDAKSAQTVQIDPEILKEWYGA